MATNTLKVKAKAKKGNMFSFMDNYVWFDIFEKGLPIKYVPYILYITAIGIFYIGNSHYAEKNIRKVDKMQQQVEDLRADFTTLKADYMFASKQSEVAQKVEKHAIYESSQPPYKIIIKK